MTMAKPKANMEELPARFSWKACPVHAIWYPSGRLAVATASTALMASPELTPGLPPPSTLAARNPL